MATSIFTYLNLLLFHLIGNGASTFPYNLEKPDKIYYLPAELKEISGIADIGENKIACITDEKGTIIIYDLVSEKITSRHSFAGAGDYEDIVYHSNIYYVLESNGDITQVNEKAVQRYGTSLTKFNNTEGLCYNKNNNSLLISTKEPPLKIVEFDLKTKELNNEPVAHIKEEKFSPTALAYLNDDELLILSGNAKLGIYSIKNKSLTIISLNKKLYPQAEGITIMKNGDLLISNEGSKKKDATILLFRK